MNILDVIGTWFVALLVVTNLRLFKVLWLWIVDNCKYANWGSVYTVLVWTAYITLVVYGVIWLWGMYNNQISMPSWTTFWKAAAIMGLYAFIWIKFLRNEAFNRWKHTSRGLYESLDNLAVAGCIYVVIIIVIAVIRL